jgi:gas vesicle protein
MLPFYTFIGFLNRSKRMTDSSRITYFWLGFAVGATAATFYAPRSGARTRKYCQTKIQETSDMLTRQAEDLRDRAVKTVKRGNQEYEHQLNKFSAAVDAGMRAFKKAS